MTKNSASVLKINEQKTNDRTRRGKNKKKMKADHSIAFSPQFLSRNAASPFDDIRRRFARRPLFEESQPSQVEEESQLKVGDLFRALPVTPSRPACLDAACSNVAGGHAAPSPPVTPSVAGLPAPTHPSAVSSLSPPAAPSSSSAMRTAHHHHHHHDNIRASMDITARLIDAFDKRDDGIAAPLGPLGVVGDDRQRSSERRSRHRDDSHAVGGAEALHRTKFEPNNRGSHDDRPFVSSSSKHYHDVPHSSDYSPNDAWDASSSPFHHHISPRYGNSRSLYKHDPLDRGDGGARRGDAPPSHSFPFAKVRGGSMMQPNAGSSSEDLTTRDSSLSTTVTWSKVPLQAQQQHHPSSSASSECTTNDDVDRHGRHRSSQQGRQRPAVAPGMQEDELLAVKNGFSRWNGLQKKSQRSLKTVQSKVGALYRGKPTES